jgi:hypothetical protein
MLDYWRQHLRCQWPAPLPTGPTFQLLHSWSGDEGGVVAGQVDWTGARITFNATVVDRMPEGLVETLIAHELAHVYHIAAGMDSHTIRLSDPRMAEERDATMWCEEDVWEILDAWGFDGTAKEEWLERYLAEHQPTSDGIAV